MTQWNAGFTTHDALRRITDLAVSAAINFNNAEVARNRIAGTTHSVRDHAFLTRSGLIDRFDALAYHLALLHESQQNAERDIQGGVRWSDQRRFVRGLTLRQRFLFDDLVFNSVAFFDYMGRFACMLLMQDSTLKLRWDKAYKWSKHANAGSPRQNLVHGTRTAAEIVQADQSWVRHLTRYRSDVIHYESEKADGSFVTRFGPSEPDGAIPNWRHEVMAYVPAAFLKELRLAPSDAKVRILDAAHLLFSRVFTTGEAVLDALAADLADRVPTRVHPGSPPGSP